jgi:CRP/FNR family transcriptional regulator, cyclic AMP receptor protein
VKAGHPVSPASDLHSLLQHMPLFAGAHPSTLASLEQSSFRKKVEKGAYLFFRGDPAEDFYLLLSGEVVIALASPDGRELIINVMQPGDFFGELGLLTGQPRSADAIVRRTAELVAIPRQAFLSALENEPGMARRLLEATATRLSRSSEFQNSLAFLDAQARLARLLLDLDSQNEERGYITISQEELAQRSGLIRQTVAKTLGQWRRQGWLLTGRGHIMLLNRNALRLWFKEQAG